MNISVKYCVLFVTIPFFVLGKGGDCFIFNSVSVKSSIGVTCQNVRFLQSRTLNSHEQHVLVRHCPTLSYVVLKNINDSNDQCNAIKESNFTHGGNETINGLSHIVSTISSNISEGKLGERGEMYTSMQFVLVLFIIIGNIPVFGRVLYTVFGPMLFASGCALAIFGAKELIEVDGLTPWPVPAENGKLVLSGNVFKEIRHPIYSGLLCTMIGLSVMTGSSLRLVLTIVLYYVLNMKSDFEEEELLKKYGEDYQRYREEVKGKFVPESFVQFFRALLKFRYNQNAEK